MINNIKKSIFLLFILVFVGITNVSAATKNIEVTNIEVKDKSGTITVVDPVFESNEVTSNITFNQIDDFVTFELTLKNNESEKYKITSITDNNTNENIQVEYSFSKDFINTGDTSKVTLKLTYKNKLLNVDQISLNDLTIKINLVNEDGDSEEIIINPTTGDNIFHYLVLLIIALVGIGLIVAKKKVKGIKIGSLFVVLAVVLLPLAVFANEKYEIKVKFNDIVIKGEYETYNISIDPGNGAPVETRQITYGEKLGDLPANPSKDGYTFDKWVDEEGNEVTKDTVITKEISVIASYNIVTYNISYDLDDGSLPSGKSNPTEYTIESQSITLNNPEKRGYTFAGWSGTGIDGQTTEVTIDHGSKGDRSYKAHYLAKDDTKYTVIHKFQKLSDGYDEETVEEHGTTGSTVPAPRKTRTGFVTPTVQNVTIEADESASVTYVYDRETYAFSITDRTYVDSTSTTDGTYPYGTSITVKAQERAGYNFAWSDGNTEYERTFELSEETNLTPEYTADDNTPYVVKHYKMDLDGVNYTIADTQNLSGTTDSPITPAVNTYEGFTSPEVQSTTIGGDGHTVVDYYYTRNQVTVTFTNTEYIEEEVTTGEHYYGEQITLTAKERDGYTFTGWTTGETNNPLTITVGTSDIDIGPLYKSDGYTVTYNVNGGSSIDAQIVNDGEKATRPATDPTKNGYTFVDWYKDSELTIVFNFNTPITEDTTIYAKWKKEQFPVVFSHEGECIFNGSDGVLTGDDCEYADGVNKYIDTGINLYNVTNINEDYEIGFTIVSYDPDEQESQATLMNTKLEGNGYPGVVFRRRDAASQFDISSKSTSTENVRKYINIAGINDVKIYRIYNSELDTQEIFYSINDGEKIKLNDLSQFNPVFNMSVWFGAAPKDATATEAQRYLKGTLSNMYIKVGTYGEERNKFEVTFDTDGGSNVEKQIVRKGGVATRPLYVPTKTGYSFVDWYADSEFTTLYDFTTPINDDITIYAKFEQDPFSLVFSHEGECTFNGKTGVLTGDDCAFADGMRKYIDTGINLYNSENHDKDYEIGFTIVSYSLENQDSQATFMNTKYEASNYPGVVFRRRNGDTTYDLSSRKTTSANETKLFEFGTINKFKLYRIYNSESGVQEIFYSINDGEKVKLNDLSQFNPEFDLSVWFGAAPTNATATDARRYLTGTLSDMYIKLGTYHEEESNNYTVTLNANGGSVSPTSITVNIGDAIGTLPTPTAPAGKSFTGWYTELTGGIEVTSTYVPNTDIEIYARYTNQEFTVTFDTDGGSEVSSQTVSYGSTATRPTTDPTKTGYVFDDWYTDDTYTTKFNFDTPITSDTTIYAHFVKVCEDNENITRLSENTCSNNENITIGDGIVCKRAVKLHEETCSQTDGNYYCSGAGYTTSGSKGTSTITYGSCGTSGTLTSGDAFTCDVNGDEKFDELTERFYYVSDYYDTSAKEFDDSTAVLIYYNNVTSGVSCNKNTYAYDSSGQNYNGPRTLVSQLPTTSQWSNISLKSDTRAILAEYQSTHDSPITTGGTLPTNFSYEGYAARLLTAKELMTGCNLTEVGRYTKGELDSCNYVMENTKYAKSSIGSYGPWLETPNASGSYFVWLVGVDSRFVISSYGVSTAIYYGARPAIEVPKAKISY